MFHHRETTPWPVFWKLVVGYLLCDAIWLFGDSASGMAEISRSLLRTGAWGLAVVTCGVGAILLSRRMTVLKVIGMSSFAICAAAAPIIVGGLAFFPAQFPRDTELRDVLSWLVVATLLLSFAFGVFAGGVGAVANLTRKRHPV